MVNPKTKTTNPALERFVRLLEASGVLTYWLALTVRAVELYPKPSFKHIEDRPYLTSTALTESWSLDSLIMLAAGSSNLFLKGSA